MCPRSCRALLAVFLGLSSSAGRPVSAKKTSSRLGAPSEKSVTWMFARASAPSRSAACARVRHLDRERRRIGRRAGRRRRAMPAIDRLRLRRAGPDSTRWKCSVLLPIDDLRSRLVPSAITRPWSMTASRSARRSASSRYCVVSSTVVPSAAIWRTQIPHLVPAARVETRRRLVQEEDLGRGDQAGGDVDAAPHAARIRPHLLAGRVREPERAEQLGGARCARPSRTGRGAGSPAPGSRGRSDPRRRTRTGR